MLLVGYPVIPVQLIYLSLQGIQVLVTNVSFLGASANSMLVMLIVGSLLLFQSFFFVLVTNSAMIRLSGTRCYWVYFLNL
jgi:hypothetical protein